MASCESYRAQMLDYLYDLLEADDRQALESHASGCPACQDELARARRQQHLLATAARMQFPAVRFEAPAAAAPHTLPLPSRRQPARRLQRWLAAALVLLTLGGLTGFGIYYRLDYRHNRQLVQAQHERMLALQHQAAEAGRQLTALPQKEVQRINAIHREIAERQLSVQVVGPSTVQSGAPATYRLFTRSLDGSSAPAEVSAQVLDGATPVKKSLEVVRESPGVFQLTLPPDLPIRPGSQPVLVVSARKEGGSRAELREALQLTAPVYSTFLSIDKPMYQPGETVHYRSLTLDRASLRPAQQLMHLEYLLTAPTGAQQTLLQGASTLTASPGGPVVNGPDGKPLQGVGAGEYVLPADAPGGEYILTVRELAQRFPEQQRKFTVNRYQKPRLNKELDYSRKTYGPGEEVQALCKVRRADRDPVRNRPVFAVAQIDGQTYGPDGQPSGQPMRFQTDDEGKVVVRFKLPASIERGLGSLQVTFDDGGSPETLVRPLPIVLKKLQVELFPEGGDLVDGLKSRVYFQVRTTLGKPADLEGQLLEDGKPMNIRVETLHDAREPGVNQGMGSFELTPRRGHKYELRIDSPVGLSQRPALPEVKADGVVLNVPGGVIAADEDIPVVVRSSRGRSFLVGAYCRGLLLASAPLDPVHFEGNEARALLKPSAPSGGVCRVTVFEVQKGPGQRKSLKPVAERLIYRRPAEQVKLTLKPDHQNYVPRQKVLLEVKAANEKDAPAPAVVMLAVVDDSVIKLADDKTLRSMPTHFLLTGEVRQPEELEYADFLLGPQKKAAAALDLLLGTQGWRRFAEQNPDLFRQLHREEADRLLVTIGQSQMQTTDLDQTRIETVQKEMAHQRDLAQAKREAALQECSQASEDTRYKAALLTLAGYDRFFDDTKRWGTPLLGVVLLAVALACLVITFRRGLQAAMPYFGGLAVATAALAFLVYHEGNKTLPQAPQQRELAMAKTANEALDRPQAPPAEWAAAPKAAPQKAPDAMPAGAADLKQDFDDGQLQPPADKPGALFPAPAPGALAPRAPMPRDAARPEQAQLGMLPHLAAKGKQAEEGRVLAGDKRLMEGGLMLKDQAKVVEEKKAVAFGAMPNAANGQGIPMPGMAAGGARGAMAPRMLVPGNRGLQLDQLEQADRRAGLRMQIFRKRMPEASPLVVREYAHTWKGADPSQRSDWAETLFWHPVLVLPDGKAEVSFQLCDSTTRFQVTAFAHTLDGRLGSATQEIESRLPLTIKAATPVEVTATDRIDLPVNLTNNTSEARQVQLRLLKHAGLELLSGTSDAQLSLPAEGTLRRGYRFQPNLPEGTAELEMSAKAGTLADDQVHLTFRVAPQGFPVVDAHSDVLEKSASHTVVLPQKWVPGTLKCQVQVYPSTLATLQQGLAAMLREPCGCFEQTSTSNYPNLLILDYLRENRQAQPEVEKRARELLTRGYAQLTSFECLNPAEKDRRGYEWFGGTAPPHEALTAYGLMEFRDMARVFDVDPAMLRRTQQYLLKQRDGKGGFTRNPRALDTFGRAPDNITNAYIVWSLTESGKEDDVNRELDTLAKQAGSSKDPYFLSLVANSLINRARTAEAVTLLEKVVAAQKDDGHLDAEQTSITGSGGRDLQIETTALAVMGWLKGNPGKFNPAVQKAVRWIGQQRGGFGGFGSTQSTILALKALIAFTRANQHTAEAGELTLFVGERSVARMKFAAGSSETLVLDVPDADKLLQPGRNPIRAEITGKNVFPYTLTWSYNTLQPVSSEKCPVRLATALARTEMREGDTVRLTVKVENPADQGQGMAVAIVGLPGGLIVPEDLKQLKDYTRLPADGSKPLLGAFELRGRELILYWRDLAPHQKIEVPIDLIGRIPGEYSGPASRGYLYYNADHKHWVEPLHVTIAPRAD